jgi:hypothetical protein
MLHFYPNLERSRALHFRVPLWENYLLHAFAWLRPATYWQYEFRVAERAIERGYGACSQFALAAIDLLNRHGIRASLVSLSNHVVVRAYDAHDREWIVDPDYGVAAPIALADIARQPALARRIYDGIAESGDAAIPDSLPAAMQLSFQARPPRDLGGPAERCIGWNGRRTRSSGSFRPRSSAWPLADAGVSGAAGSDSQLGNRRTQRRVQAEGRGPSARTKPAAVQGQ